MARRQAIRIFSGAFKEAAVRRVLAGETIRAVADELRIGRRLLYTWRDYYEQGGAEALVPRGRPPRAVAWARRRALMQPPSRQGQPRGGDESARPARLIELERKVAQQALELDFFKAALRRVKAPARRSDGRGGRASSRPSRR